MENDSMMKPLKGSVQAGSALSEETDFIALIENAVLTHWEREAFTDFEGETLRYKDVARIIEKLHILFEHTGIRQGDKIAVCGRNSAHWAVAYLATLTYGAVCVPVLHEFKASQVHNIVNHSEARLLFAGDFVWKTLVPEEMPTLEGIVSIVDFQLLVCRSEKLNYAREHLNALYGAKFPKYFRREHVKYRRCMPDELALINYTSGTTSRSKGVMVPYRALWSNYDFACGALNRGVPVGGRIVSMLPMAHMYGMAFEYLYPFLRGVHIYFLSRVPAPKVIFEACVKIRPHLIVAVPLVVEKVIKNIVLPKLQKPALKALLGLPLFFSRRLREQLRMQLYEAFGGNFYEIIVGGASLNSEVEQLVHRLGLNVTVGYGTTETAPIITYSDWTEFRPGSCGYAAPRMEVKIDSPDPQNQVGEILTRGVNVMLGYYKNEEQTAAVIDGEGWYHTGDLGVMDADGYVYIKGRSKNILLGANGQNIYPEEIEDKLNTMPYVGECIVVQRNDKLHALVYPNVEAVERDGLSAAQVKTLMEQNRRAVNAAIPAYEHIVSVVIVRNEFEKTAKRSIKRYLYQDIAIEELQ